MTEIYKDASYFDTVRSESHACVSLINNTIPDGITIDADENGEQSATYFRFASYYKYVGLPDTTQVNVPVRSFSCYAKTHPTEEDGFFGAVPSITLTGVFPAGAEITLLCENGETSEQYLKSIKILCYATRQSEDASYDEVQDFAPGAFNVVTVPVSCQKLQIELMSATQAGQPLTVRSVLFGQHLTVTAEDIEEMVIDSKYDITHSALQSTNFELKLFDTEKRYNSFVFNTVYVVCDYQNYEGTIFRAEGRVYFVTTPPELDDTSDTPRTIIKACDLISRMTGLYTSPGYYNAAVTPYTPISDLVKSAREFYKNDMFIAYEGAFPRFTGNWNVNRLVDIPYNTALQKYSFFSYGAYATNDLIHAEGSDIIAKDTQISLNEQFEKPKHTTYTKLRNLTVEVKNAELEDYDTIFYLKKLPISDDNVITVDLGGEYLIPKDSPTSNAVQLQKLSEPESGTTYYPGSDVFTYTSNVDSIEIKVNNRYDLPQQDSDGVWKVKVTVQGQKITSSTYKSTESINPVGEDLTISTDAFGKFYAPREIGGANIPSDNMREVAAPYKYIDSYDLDMRGRIDLDVLDELAVEVEKDRFKRCIITAHKLTFNGAYSSTMTVFTDGSGYDRLTPGDTLYPSDTLYPKE